jgi:hypothetical protein
VCVRLGEGVVRGGLQLPEWGFVGGATLDRVTGCLTPHLCKQKAFVPVPPTQTPYGVSTKVKDKQVRHHATEEQVVA